MKKFVNFILSMMILASSLYADFKIMGGLNLSKYHVSPEKENTNWNYKMGFLAGIGLEKNFNQKIFLEVDVLYFQKGSKFESSALSRFKSKYNLSTVSIPLLLRIKFLEGTSPYVSGGVEFSSIVSHTVKSEGEEEIDLKETTKSIDHGFVFGCGYEIEIQENLFFFIEARYNLGQANIVSNPLEEKSMKTRAILIVLGVKS